MRNKILTYKLLIILIGTTLSCSDWLDVNDNPNTPATVEYKDILPAGISSAAYVVGGKYQVLGALWSQHWTQSLGASQYSGLDSYDINSSTFDSRQFGELYSGSLKALEHVKQESFKEQEWNYYLIATVMQAYVFQILADLYDEIPFSEALRGDEGLEPIYESGQAVYDSLLARINDALDHDFENEDLKKPEEEDILFKGDMDSWIAFANTLKLKILLRQSEVRPEFVLGEIQKLYSTEPEFLKTDVKMTQFQNQSGRRNPLYETEMIYSPGNLILSNTLYSYLQDNSDFDRIDLLFNTPSSGSGGHKALLQGNYNDPDEPAGTNISSYSTPIMYPHDPVFLLSRIESEFLQAEAIIRYKVDNYSVAKEQYELAIRSSFSYLIGRVSNQTVDPDNLAIVEMAEPYYFGGAYQFPSEGSDIEVFIESIMVQKWIALAGFQSLETFFEQNRTHYPRISVVAGDDDSYEPGYFTVSVNNVTSNRFPKRLIFPESEYSSNRNTPAKKDVWEKIWWDVKPEITE